MKKTKFSAFLSTTVVCYLFWLLLTGQLVALIQPNNPFSAQVLIAGAIVSVLTALFSARFFVHEKAFWFFNPIKLILLAVYCLIIFMWELIKANVSMFCYVFGLKKTNPGIVKVETDLESEYAQSMLANSITLTPGTITMDIAESKGKTYYYIHWIDVSTQDMKEAGDSIKGTMEKWIRRIWR
ncbi:MAG: Na+/H+ antiporter subunit E [Oscillospiraceae bacterium]|nr:Na+/H+ antiporter subunit E [Oscillospiraceae bacterium]